MNETTEKRIPIISVAAWSGTGKTTYLERLLPLLKARGLRIAVVKHDAHEIEVDHEGKDSYRLTHAGADVTAVFSSQKAFIIENRPLREEELFSHRLLAND